MLGGVYRTQYKWLLKGRLDKYILLQGIYPSKCWGKKREKEERERRGRERGREREMKERERDRERQKKEKREKREKREREEKEEREREMKRWRKSRLNVSAGIMPSKIMHSSLSARKYIQ